MLIEKIGSPEDLKSLPEKDVPALAEEIRTLLLRKLSKRGGHFGPNLGIVEATIALHRVFDSPKDKIVFDVSHQTYPHKMLTGRAFAWLDESRYGGVTGFTNPAESEHDQFTIGHTSTSLSLALGIAKARDLAGGRENVVALIGDGSLSGGEALEGLNVAGELGTNFIIVVNDNGMSIAENHGGLYASLRKLRETGGKSPDNLFRAMNLDYTFVADGNDEKAVEDALRAVKGAERPVVVHIVTQKAKGYKIAEADREPWHYAPPFDLATGRPLHAGGGENYGDISAEFLLRKMKEDRTLAVITAGTPGALGFDRKRREEAGAQFVDVGIAEETATAMAGGMARNGGKGVFGVFGTFFQRCYDQVQQDVCVNGSAAVFVVCAASVWGMNDVTHTGWYDVQMLSHIPSLKYLAPTSAEEYLDMLGWAIRQKDGPVAIRQPANGVVHSDRKVRGDYADIPFDVVRKGKDVAIIALGDFFQLGEAAADRLAESGISATLVNPLSASHLDEKCLSEIAGTHRVVVTLEDGILSGGWGQTIASFYGGDGRVKVLNRGFRKKFLDLFRADDVLRDNRLTAEQIAEDAKAAL